MKLRVLTSIGFSVALMIALFSCQSGMDIKTIQYVTNGKKLYETHCLNCHGQNGEGLGKLYPPLTDKKYLEDHRDRLPCIVRHGLSGSINVDGESYNGTMPANGELTPVDIAYLLSYVTIQFGQLHEKI